MEIKKTNFSEKYHTKRLLAKLAKYSLTISSET